VSLATAQGLRLAMVGFGAAAQAFVPALAQSPLWSLVAVADPSPASRAAAAVLPGVAWFDDLPSLLAALPVDAVYIATPTPSHAELAVQALRAGCHVLVEKPMAVSVRQCQRMVRAARRARRVLMVGHSHGQDAPIAAMRAIIESGEIGAVRMVHSWCFTNWMHRPRRGEELRSELGGGVTFRQGAHQFDIARYLCGGRMRSVRAQTFDWMPQRAGVGAHTVFMDFEDGAVATAVYNGYGGLNGSELVFGISEWGEAAGQVRATASAIGLSEQEALAAKQARSKNAIAADAPHPPFFGLTVVSCEGGDLRQSPHGVWVDTPQGRREVLVPSQPSPRAQLMAQWHACIQAPDGRLQDGSWGLATLEVCEAALRSSQLRKEVRLRHQVGLDSPFFGPDMAA
jgi:phthalate 4,5-cis-dihydrodiol dehydrogenase